MDRLLENDTVLKILSILVAIAFWVQVSGSNVQTANRSIGPVTVVWSLPPANKNLNVTKLQPNAIELQIQGPPKAVAEAKASAMTALVSLNHISHPGTYTLPVVASVPAGTSLVSVTPAQIVVTVDQTVTKKMNVSVKPMGSPAQGFQLTKINASVQSATVTGPSEQLSTVKALVAEVPISSQNANVDEQIMLLPVDSSGKIVSHLEVNPPMVNVTAEISAIPPHKDVGVVVRLNGVPAAGYKVKSIAVDPNTITITGKNSALAGVKTVDTTPINISGATSDVTQLVPVNFPPGVSSTVNQVTVTIAIEKSS